MPIISSLWDGLSPHLIASFYEVEKKGDGTWGSSSNTDPYVVKAPLIDASLDLQLNWQSPFENAGPESKAPALMAMLQSGALQPVIEKLTGKSGEEASKAQQMATSTLNQFEGRTGITRLNSTQVFNGMPPSNIQVTALFRAWKDAMKEVEEPVNKLMEWLLPIELSNDGSILARAIETAKGDMGLVEALMPSKSPVRIAMKYKGRIYSPLVVESVTMPIDSAVTDKGLYVEMALPIKLSSLTALDRTDWKNSRKY